MAKNNNRRYHPYSDKQVINCKDTGEIVNGSQYLNTKHWKNTRLRIFKKYDGECQRCRSVIPFESANIHHITYKRIGEEKDSDLILLCRKCHTCVHKSMKDKKEQNKSLQSYIQMLDKKGKEDVINYIKRKYDL